MPTSPRHHLRLRPALLAGALVSGLLVAPVGSVVTATPASAAPCTVILGMPLCLLPPAATAPLTVSGDKRTGGTVVASAVTWDQEGVTTTYQWSRGGEAIANATAQTYTLTSADFDEEITVTATGRGRGALPGTAMSEAFQPAKGAAIKASVPPKLTGGTSPGSTLTVNPGTWPGETPPAFTYEWYRTTATGRGAERIAGVTGTTYQLLPADVGRKVVTIVRAERVGYEKGGALSNVVAVDQVASATGLALVRSTVKRTQAPTVRVVLRSGGGAVPAGVVTIFDGNRRVRSFQLAPSAGGVATFQIARQSVGLHRLTARYSGDVAHRPSASGVAVLRVTK